MELTHTFRAQQTGWWCGPAAVAVALSCRGIFVSQADLVTKLGTTINGTDSITDVVRTMNGYVGPGAYDSVDIDGQAATDTEAAALAADVLFTLDAGYALVVNGVGTLYRPDGTGNPYTYRGGHYVAVVGYRSGGTEVLVADVAAGEYWVTTAALADWIALRGYSRATLAAPTTTTGDDDVKIVRVNQDGGIWITNGPTRYRFSSPDQVEAALRVWGLAQSDILPIDIADLTACGADVEANAPTTGARHRHTFEANAFTMTGQTSEPVTP